MAEAPFIATPLADLDTQQNLYRPSVKTGRAFLFVTALLWLGALALCVVSWAGVFAIGVSIARWMGS